MLSCTDIGITEIAFACGFASSQHFAVAFKKALNTTPSSYREQARS
jgi:transcriptional regulator GlxA family with amidase domain